MRVQVFAILKEHFDNEFELKDHVADTEELKTFLAGIRPEAGNILNNCRFAVNDEFVDKDFKLTANDTIAIIPPSSGG